MISDNIRSVTTYGQYTDCDNIRSVRIYGQYTVSDISTMAIYEQRQYKINDNIWSVRIYGRLQYQNYDNIQLSPLLKCDLRVCLPEKSKVTRGW